MTSIDAPLAAKRPHFIRPDALPYLCSQMKLPEQKAVPSKRTSKKAAPAAERQEWLES